MYSSIASKKRSSKTEDLNLSTIGINRSFSMINKVDNPIEWYEIKTPSTLVSRRTLHSSCLHQDRLYIYGGYDSNLNGILSQFNIYNLKDAKWTDGPRTGSFPASRHSHSCVVFGRKMYIYGGITNAFANTNKMHSYDFDNGEWSQVEQNGRSLDSHRVCNYQDQMIVVSGYSNSELKGDILSYSFTNKSWNVLFQSNNMLQKTCPEPRANFSLNLYKDSLIMYGGQHNSKVFEDVWRFDLINYTYTQIIFNHYPQKRFGHSALIHENILIVFGGTSGVVHERNDLIVMDLEEARYMRYWNDSQEDRGEKANEIPSNVKSRRDSAKRSGDETVSESESKQIEKRKYRNHLKEVNYYNNLYETAEREATVKKKMKKNALLSTIEVSKDPLNLTSTYEILTNSILLTMGKNSKQLQKGEKKNSISKKRPKARDGYSVDRWQNNLVIFGGGMHKVCFNDLILINIDLIQSKFEEECE